MNGKIKIIFFISMIYGSALNGQPITLFPSNPHYFMVGGKPEILITSAEHYGAVVNGEFDYVKYFDACNLTEGLNPGRWESTGVREN